MEATGRNICLVHKEGEEGIIHIDLDTGIITTPLDERPDWADGLASAIPHERSRWYEQRLGPQYAAEHKSPEAMVFQDLSWIGVDDEGDEVELSADLDYRQEVLAKVLGLDLDEGEFRSHIVTELEMSADRRRTPAEAAEIAAELGKSFGLDNHSEKKSAKAGTD